MTPPRLRKADVGEKDRGVQLEMPGVAEPAPPGGGDREGLLTLPGATRGSARPGGAPAPAAATQEHPPVILRNGPRDYAVATWLRDEDGEPVYKVVQRGIKAASTAGVLARKLVADRGKT